MKAVAAGEGLGESSYRNKGGNKGGYRGGERKRERLWGQRKMEKTRKERKEVGDDWWVQHVGIGGGLG